MKAAKLIRTNTKLLFAVFSLLLLIAPVWGQNPFSGAPVSVSVSQSSNLKSAESASYLDNLTEEETRLLNLGLLPRYYPSLKQCLDQKCLVLDG